MVVQVIPQTIVDRSAAPPHRGRFSIDGFRGTRVHAGVTEIGPVLANPRELSLETAYEYRGERHRSRSAHAASIRENAFAKLIMTILSAGTFKISAERVVTNEEGVSGSWRAISKLSLVHASRSGRTRRMRYANI